MVSSHLHGHKVIKDQATFVAHPPLPTRQRFRANGSHQLNEADHLIESFIDARFGIVAFRVMGGVAAKPACGLCVVRYAALVQATLRIAVGIAMMEGVTNRQCNQGVSNGCKSTRVYH